MNVQIFSHEHCDVVKMAGRVDSYTSLDLQEALDGLLEKQRNAALWVLGVVLTVVITGSMGFLWMLLTNQVVIDLIRTSP